MISRAISRYTRISPKKARLLTRPLRGKTVAEAYAFLKNMNKRASYFIYNVLKSAFMNAHKKNPAFKEGDLYISGIVADSGPMLKRYRAASMGRAVMIRKRTSHLTVQLEVKKPAKKIEPKRGLKKPSIFKKKAGISKQLDKRVSSAKTRKRLSGKKK